MEQMHEISFGRLENGSIQLEQQSGHGERDVIHLHPEQLKFITRRMTGMTEATAAQVEDLERKLSILAGDLEFLIKDSSIRRQIVDCGDGCELMARFDGLMDLAFEFDGNRLMPRGEPEVQEAPTSDSNSEPSADAPTTATNAVKRGDIQQLGLDV